MVDCWVESEAWAEVTEGGQRRKRRLMVSNVVDSLIAAGNSFQMVGAEKLKELSRNYYALSIWLISLPLLDVSQDVSHCVFSYYFLHILLSVLFVQFYNKYTRTKSSLFRIITRLIIFV